MKKFIAKPSRKLDSSEVSSFISDHLPYRIKVLENLVSYPHKVKTDKFWPSIYESGQIVCRAFIQFFGLGADGKDNPSLNEYHDYFAKDGLNSYEVKIIDLGFDFIRLNDLTITEQDLLAHA